MIEQAIAALDRLEAALTLGADAHGYVDTRALIADVRAALLGVPDDPATVAPALGPDADVPLVAPCSCRIVLTGTEWQALGPEPYECEPCDHLTVWLVVRDGAAIVWSEVG